MARRTRSSSSNNRNTNPAVTAAKGLDKQIARAEANAQKFDEKAREAREAIEPLKAAREALGNVNVG